MRNIFKILLMILPLFSFTGCDILDSSDSSSAPLDSKLDFQVIESYDNYESVSVPDIYIELKTEKIYGCLNYGIITNHKLEDKSIIVNITGIHEPEVCLTALGPAKERIKIGRLRGIYELKINGSRFNDTYNLLISDSLIILDGSETASTKPLISFIYRYPQNSFAYICGATSDTTIGGNFIDTLKQVISLTEFTFSDIALKPYPDMDLGYHYRSAVRYFYYENEDEFDKIQNVMRSYKEDHFSDNDAGLLIINWMNKKIRSWLL